MPTEPTRDVQSDVHPNELQAIILTFRIVDRTVLLDSSDELHAHLLEEESSPVADLAEALSRKRHTRVSAKLILATD